MSTNIERKEIHRLLRNTVIEPPVFGEWLLGNAQALAAKLHPLSAYLEQHAPHKLYKMRQCKENAMNALRDGHLFLSRADYFNDPYDCLLAFDPKLLEKRIEAQLIRKNMRSYVDQMDLVFPIETPNGTTFPDADSSIDFCLEQDYVKVFLRELDTLYPEIVEQLQKNTFIASLTENIGSPIMWSHYADEHRGFAVEYEFRPDFFCPAPMIVTDADYPWHGYRSLLPVQYSSTRIDATDLADWFSFCRVSENAGLYDINHDLSVFMPDLLMTTKMSLRKSKSWSYEQEWRLTISHSWPSRIDPDETARLHLLYPASAIYLGDRIEDANRTKLLAIAKHLDIPAYEMYIDYTSSSYEMSYRQIQ